MALRWRTKSTVTTVLLRCGAKDDDDSAMTLSVWRFRQCRAPVRGLASLLLCRSLLAGDSQYCPSARVPHRLQAGSYTHHTDVMSAPFAPVDVKPLRSKWRL